MDHHEQHHQHHRKEREEEKKEKKTHESEAQKSALPIHPAWLFVVGTVLVLLIVLGWIFFI